MNKNKNITSFDNILSFIFKYPYICFFAVLGIVLLAPFWAWMYTGFVHLDNPYQTFGTVGDTFGLLNPILSFGALIFALISLNLQRQEMHDQREQFQKQAHDRKEAARMELDAALLGQMESLVDLNTSRLTMGIQILSRINFFNNDPSAPNWFPNLEDPCYESTKTFYGVLKNHSKQGFLSPIVFKFKVLAKMIAKDDSSVDEKERYFQLLYSVMPWTFFYDIMLYCILNNDPDFVLLLKNNGFIDAATRNQEQFRIADGTYAWPEDLARMDRPIRSVLYYFKEKLNEYG